jgi:hypothetical protein
MAIDVEKQLQGLSPDARLRVENALKEALTKEGALNAAGFDRGPFDRSGFDRSTDVVSAPDFLAKVQPAAEIAKEQGPTS